MLSDYIRRGGKAVLEGMGVAFPSGMPAFEGRLVDRQIASVLAYIKSTWPDQQRNYQAERTAAEAEK